MKSRSVVSIFGTEINNLHNLGVFVNLGMALENNTSWINFVKPEMVQTLVFFWGLCLPNPFPTNTQFKVCEPQLSLLYVYSYKLVIISQLFVDMSLLKTINNWYKIIKFKKIYLTKKTVKLRVLFFLVLICNH